MCALNEVFGLSVCKDNIPDILNVVVLCVQMLFLEIRLDFKISVFK